MKPMRSSDLDLDDDGVVVVEASTVEAALTVVRERCGPEAVIIKAEKIRSKGIGGFFCKELFRVVVASPDAARVPMSDSSPAMGNEAVDVVLQKVEADEKVGAGRNVGADQNTGGPSFGEALQAELTARARRPATASEIANGDPRLTTLMFQRKAVEAETIDIREPQDRAASTLAREYVPELEAQRLPLGHPIDEWAPRSGPIRWSVDNLSRIGLPYRLIRDLADLDPTDDLAWVYRLAESAAPLCGTMPDRSLVLVGHDVSTASAHMGVPEVTHLASPSVEGDLAVSMANGPEAGRYLERIRAGRPVHLLCDDLQMSDRLLGDDAIVAAIEVVSCAPGLLVDALQAVVVTGAVLGYLVSEHEIVRVTPFELALAVRALLPRR